MLFVDSYFRMRAILTFTVGTCFGIRSGYIVGKRASMASMDLRDVTQALVGGNSDLFEEPAVVDAVVELAEDDRFERKTDIPAMINVEPPDTGFYSDVWTWVKQATGYDEPSSLPYPLHTVDYLNAAIYKRASDPSDIQDPQIAGDILRIPKGSWSLWPNPQNINYKFDIPIGHKSTRCVKTVFTEAVLRIKEASNECIQFTESPEGDNRVTLRVRSDEKFKCYASLGYNSKGENIINIGLGCTNVGTVMHLILHTLGMAHEDQRPDAQDYRRVVDANIDVYGMSPSAHVNPTTTDKYQQVFVPLHNTKTRWEEEILKFPYEYGSIMHNSIYRYTFDMGKKQTLSGVYQGKIYDDLAGNRGFITTR
jgi:hypothetical protein